MFIVYVHHCIVRMFRFDAIASQNNTRKFVNYLHMHAPPLLAVVEGLTTCLR